MLSHKTSNEMALQDLPIRRKLMRVFLMTTVAVIAVTFFGYFLYEVLTYRNTMVRNLSMLGAVVARNSTAALAFDNKEEAYEILSALQVDEDIVEASLYDTTGRLFVIYPRDAVPRRFDSLWIEAGYTFASAHLHGFEPVVQDDERLGTLYICSKIDRVYYRLLLYLAIAALVIASTLGISYFLSRRLQKEISLPILRLAKMARAISDRHDYSVRAQKTSNDEIGSLTDAFNHMLGTIDAQTREITALNERLEERVKERTREFEAANRELEAFSYSVSHDLRAPLRSIHGYMNIFAEEYGEKVDDEGRRLINIITKNGRKMGQLIDDLLTFSQLGRKELHKSMVSMSEMVAEVWSEQAFTEPDRKIKFISGDLPAAVVDPATMKQVWVNLISNACKYTGQRQEPVIEVGSLTAGGEIVYFVRDNGAGFDMKYYDKLFGVFHRLHSEEEFPGTGVGLAIVHRVITRHGGRVWAESTLGEGAVFYFTVPA